MGRGERKKIYLYLYVHKISLEYIQETDSVICLQGEEV